MFYSQKITKYFQFDQRENDTKICWQNSLQGQPDTLCSQSTGEAEAKKIFPDIYYH